MTHQVSCQSLLNHGNFSVGLYIRRRSSQGYFQHFSSSSLNRFIILPFSALMEQEPRHQIACTVRFAVEQLLIHFLHVFSEKCNVEKRSITVRFCSLLDSVRWDKVDDIVSHFLTLLLRFGSCFNKPPALILKKMGGWKMHLINKNWAPNKRRVRINVGCTRQSFK